MGELGRAIIDTIVEHINHKIINNSNVKSIVDGVNNNTDAKFNTGRLGRLVKIINNINIELNAGGLGKSNKISKKEVKIYKSNLF